MVMLRMASGALVHVNSSFRAVYGYDQRIEAFGAKGMLISRNHQPTTLERYERGRHPPGSAAATSSSTAMPNRTRASSTTSSRALDEKRAPSIGLDDGRRALLIAEAAVASAKVGAPVAIPG